MKGSGMASMPSAGGPSLADLLAPAASAGAAPPLADPAGAAMIGGGGMGVAPDPLAGMQMSPNDPAMAAMGGAAGPMYPSADPAFIGGMLEELLALRAQDHAKLEADQQAALAGNPLFQALLSGAPMGPGAGQDGAALGMGDGGELAMPTDMGDAGLAMPPGLM